MEIICKNGTPTTRNPLNVYEQAQIRLEKIFGHFDNIYVSFSGGKDSGVLSGNVVRGVKSVFFI